MPVLECSLTSSRPGSCVIRAGGSMKIQCRRHVLSRTVRSGTLWRMSGSGTRLGHLPVAQALAVSALVASALSGVDWSGVSVRRVIHSRSAGPRKADQRKSTPHVNEQTGEDLGVPWGTWECLGVSACKRL